MRAVWQWPCALIALLLSGFAGLRSLPGDGVVLDEPETRVVVSVAKVALAESGQAATYALPLPITASAIPVARPLLAAQRPASALRMGSARGPRAP